MNNFVMFSLGSIAGFSITSVFFAISFGLRFIGRNYGLKGDFNTKKRDNLKIIKRERRGFGSGNAKKIKRERRGFGASSK